MQPEIESPTVFVEDHPVWTRALISIKDFEAIEYRELIPRRWHREVESLVVLILMWVVVGTHGLATLLVIATSCLRSSDCLSKVVD